MPLAAKHYGIGAYPIFFALVVVVSMLWFLWEVTPGRPLLGVATTVLGFAYVGGLGGFAGLLLEAHDGVGLMLGVAICTIAYDVVRVLRRIAVRHDPIAPKVSPNKTVEGTVAGMVASVVVGAVDRRPDHPVGRAEQGWRSACSSRSARSSVTCASR